MAGTPDKDRRLRIGTVNGEDKIEMELYIAGGCGEHGRNCFYLETEDIAWLVDCGVMAGAEGDGKFPHLNEKQIEKLQAVFLTHSHADHTGAIPWLLRQGYEGSIIATTPTFSQLPFECHQKMELDKICMPTEKGTIGKLGVSWGRSGHCEGSVWLQFFTENKTILFSGDYTEASKVYPCDRLRDRYADLAVVDCAYGHDTRMDVEYIDNVVKTVKGLLTKGRMVFLPVPKYGRGLDLLLLLCRKMPDIPLCGDAHFIRQAQRACQGGEWYLPFPRECLQRLQHLQEDTLKSEGIVFLSDPQLRGKTGEYARTLLEAGAFGVMTGTPEPGSFSEKLLNSGEMIFVRYPVHLNEASCRKLLAENQIERVVYYHSTEFYCEKRIKV